MPIVDSKPDPARERRAKALYDALRAEIGELDGRDQLALVNAFRQGLPWSELEDHTRDVFRTVAG